jgi:hypothetical protein
MTITKTPLTPAQSARKAELEQIIRNGAQTFRDVGEALGEVRDSGLYLDEYGTFGDYCIQKWDLGRSRAYQLIEAANVARNVSTVVDIPNEATAREIGKLPPREQLKAVKALAKSGCKINSASVRREAERRKPRGNGDQKVMASAIIDVEEVQNDSTSELSEETKWAVIQIIDAWYKPQRNYLNQYPAVVPDRVVDMIKKLFQ